MKLKWKEKTKAGKVIFSVSIGLALICIVLCTLQLLGIWEQSRYITQPLIGVILLLQAVEQRSRKNRGAAILSACAALFVFGCTAAIWLL